MKTLNKGATPRVMVGLGCAVVVLAVILIALSLLDSPAQERLRQLAVLPLPLSISVGDREGRSVMGGHPAMRICSGWPGGAFPMLMA